MSILDRDLFELVGQALDVYPDLVAFEDFGPYRIDKDPIGKGGMGEVYLAEDLSAGRRVAIKFLRSLWSEPDLPERFTHEIKTLAKLEHSFIARLYDAGIHPSGTPYFTMEYVEGKPLDEYCREQRCSLEQRIRLFRSVCEAVQYAHNLLIVHRDLKPSNIFIKEDGTPKLLDFGIAKELESVDQPVSQTNTDLRFTRAYAAPEQIRREPVGVYTDVYALGVILYELLAGTHPYELESCTPGQAESLITGEQEPEKPSIAAHRTNQETRVSRAAWKDLDVLCLKAINKDVGRRYQSVVELTQDVDHFLNAEPLKARPDTLRYRTGKFVSRHKRSAVATSLALLFAFGLTAFVVGRLASARSATLAEAARTEKVEQFMLSLFEGGDKAAGPTDNLQVVTLLDRGVQDAQALNREPAIQAELYRTLGRSYQQLGKFDKAQSLLQTALKRRQSIFGSGSREAVESLLDLGRLDIDRAQLPEAERAIREVLALSQRNLPPNDSSLARAREALGEVLQERGDYNKAAEQFNSAIHMQPSTAEQMADLAASTTGLSDAQFKLGHYSVADDLIRKAMALHKQLYGERHPKVAVDLRNLGNVQMQWGHYAQAEQYFRQALAIDQAWYGVEHPESADMLSYVAQSLMFQKKYTESEKLFQQALVSMEHAYGQMHPRVALVLTGLSSVHSLLWEDTASIADNIRALEIYRSAYGEEHEFTAVALSNLATNYLETKQYKQAEPLFRRVVALFSKIQSPQHFNTGVARMKLGRTLLREGRFQEGEVESLASYEILSKLTDPSNTFIQTARRDLIKEYEALKQPEKVLRFRTELAANTH